MTITRGQIKHDLVGHDALVERMRAFTQDQRAPGWGADEPLTFVVTRGQVITKWHVVVADDALRDEAATWILRHPHFHRVNDPGGVLILCPVQ